MAVNNLYQPRREILSMINQCLKGKTSGYERPIYPVLQMLWGIITSTNVDYAELMWEEFVQAIQTFLTNKANLGSPTKKGMKDKPYVIPYCRFTKLIICHLGRTHNIYQRSTSPFHLAEEDLRLGNLKFVPKGEDNEHDQKVAAEKGGKKKPATAKQLKSKPAKEKTSKPAPAPKPKVTQAKPANPSHTKHSKLGVDTDKTNSGGDTEILLIDEEQGKDVDNQVNLEEKTVELDQNQAGSDPEDPLSSTGTLSSMQNLDDAYTIGDQFLNDKSTEDEPGKLNVEAEVVSMSGSYKSLPKHKALFEALEASMDRENKDEFLAEKDKSQKRRFHSPQPRKHLTLEMLLPASKHQSAPYQDQPVEDAPIPDDVNILDSEDTDTAHLLKIKTRPDWLKLLPGEDRPETP
nr:hypothetical protein [Tanacetum cinerariifolium]